MSVEGAIAEREAYNFLKKNKYKLLDFNYKSRFGEIDLILKYKKEIVFVEVKMRNENSIAEPGEFVDRRKQQKIIATARDYLCFNDTKLQPRFDIVEVFYKNGKINSIKHLENAFTLD